MVVISLALFGVSSTADAAPAPGGGPVPPATRVLSYNYLRQERWYWCSAAAAQIALSVRGVSVSQQTLANKLQLGTGTSWGLDDVSYLVNVLNDDIPRSYSVGFAQSAAELGSEVFQNVNQNLAVLINLQSLPGKSWDGHWATIVGYQEYGARLLVLDPDNGSPNGIWLSASTVFQGLKKTNGNRYVA